MKIKFYLLVCLLILSLNGQKASAQNPQGNPIVLSLDNDNHGSGGNNLPKTPILPPEVSICSHNLYFTESHAEFVLTLTDEDENVVYVTNVYATDTQIVLPVSFSGAFKLRLYTDAYCFVGEITL